MLNAPWAFLIRKKKPSKFILPRFFNAVTCFVGILKSIFEDMSEENRQVVGVGSINVILHVYLKYSHATVNPVAYSYYIVVKWLALGDLSVSYRCMTAMSERNPLHIVRMQFVSLAVRVAPPRRHHSPIRASRRRRKI